MKVYVCGDTHQQIDHYKLSTKNWPEQKKLTKNDLVIILGDFGGFFGSVLDKESKYWLDWYTDKQYQACFIDGNHEAFPMFMNSRKILFHEAVARVCWETRQGNKLLYLPRGEIYRFNDSRVFVCGGADSVDRGHRMEGVSWWPEERLSSADIERSIDHLDMVGWEVDYVLAHTAPKTILQQCFNVFFGNEPHSHEKFFDLLYDKLYYREWHCGHWHEDKVCGHVHFHYQYKPFQLDL